jgi:hypothetical protein
MAGPISCTLSNQSSCRNSASLMQMAQPMPAGALVTAGCLWSKAPSMAPPIEMTGTMQVASAWVLLLLRARRLAALCIKNVASSTVSSNDSISSAAGCSSCSCSVPRSKVAVACLSRLRVFYRTLQALGYIFGQESAMYTTTYELHTAYTSMFSFGSCDTTNTRKSKKEFFAR